MSFVDTIFDHLTRHPERAFVTEVHGERLVPTLGGLLRSMVASARAALREAGVREGDRVALLAPNSARWVAADLALLAEGATVVPLYARQAADELAFMVRDAEVTLVITDGATLAESLRGAGVETPMVDLASLFVGPTDVREPPRARSAESVATIIYTSGSSGQPKGVLTTVGNVDAMLPALDAKLRELTGRSGGSDRVFHYLPLCFSGSRLTLWACLFRGNGVMLSTSLEDLQRELKAADPHYFLNVPALLERVRRGVGESLKKRPRPIAALYERAMEAWRRTRAGTAGKRDQAILYTAHRVLFPTIKKQIGKELLGLICGSAPLSEETQSWFELIGIPVYQVYGLTETTAIVTIDRVGAITPGRVGYPIRGAQVRLGEGGELQVRGPTIFPGYFKREEATREAFTEDGFFRTGDQCSIDERGSVRLIGRVKNLLVPSSGHNVAPEPLEELLCAEIPGALNAVVVGHGRPHLVALLAGDISQANLTTVLARINAQLPHYKRIRRAHVVAEPFTIENGMLTANTKLRRNVIESRYAREIDGLYAQLEERVA